MTQRTVMVLVAHPDDETLWVGGTMLMRPDWSWRVASLCRGNDPDRRPRFFQALEHLGGQGDMGDLDDGAEQSPLSGRLVQQAVKSALQGVSCDLIVTHSPFGEYTRHRRHEEIGQAVLHLWQVRELNARSLWMFAYSDQGNAQLPTAIQEADLVVPLSERVWRRKLAIVEQTYNFPSDSWEARCTPVTEAFWCFDNPDDAAAWQRRHVRERADEAAQMGTGEGE